MVKLHATSALPIDNMRKFLIKQHLTKQQILPKNPFQQQFIYISH